MNCLNCQSCLCSSPLLMRAEIFSQLADVHGCCLTPNSSICMRCQWDWWLTQQRGIGRRGGGGTVWKCVCLCVCVYGVAIKGGQAMTQRFWSAASSGCQPACLCGWQYADSSPPYRIPWLVSARLGYALSRPRQSPFLHAHILDQFRGQLCCYKYRNIWCMLSSAYAHIKFRLTLKGNF